MKQNEQISANQDYRRTIAAIRALDKRSKANIKAAYKAALNQADVITTGAIIEAYALASKTLNTTAARKRKPRLTKTVTKPKGTIQ